MKFCCVAGLVLMGMVGRAGEAPAPLPPPKPIESRLGINLAGLGDLNTEYPFLDVFKLARPWISQRQGEAWGKGPALDLDPEGWPRRLEPDCWVDTALLTFGHAPKGRYVCLYDGVGELEFWGGKIRSVAPAPGRVVVEMDGTHEGIFLRLKRTNPERPVRNIRFLLPGHEFTHAREVFHPAFLARWAGFNTIRFMDWMDTNDSEQKTWADRPTPGTYTYGLKGAPVEVMVDLCNRMGANPWFCLPHQASDTYVRRFAELVKTNLNPELKIHIEYSNEVWNSMFAQHGHAEAQAKVRNLGAPDRPWEGAANYYARRSVEIFRLWEDVFDGRERLVRVIAWQAASGDYWTDKMVLAHADTWKSADALAIAPYVSFLVGPESKPPVDEVAKWTVAQVLDHAEQQALPECLGWMRTQARVAAKYRLRLLAYEAGQHLVGVGGGENNDAVTQLFIEANRHPRMGTIYRRYLDAWRDAGGDLACLFSSVAKPSKWGSWGLLEFGDDTGSPKFDAVREWNRRNWRR